MDMFSNNLKDRKSLHAFDFGSKLPTLEYCFNDKEF